MIFDPEQYGDGWYDQRRRRMIAETGAWLTWALRHNVQVPKIPTIRVGQDDMGYTHRLRLPGARAAVKHWWDRAIYTVGSLSDKF